MRHPGGAWLSTHHVGSKVSPARRGEHSRGRSHKQTDMSVSFRAADCYNLFPRPVRWVSGVSLERQRPQPARGALDLTGIGCGCLQSILAGRWFAIDGGTRVAGSPAGLLGCGRSLAPSCKTEPESVGC